MSFVLDARIAGSSHPITSLALCEARLQDDARFPWIVLIPRRLGAVELAGLSTEERAHLLAETLRAGPAVRAVGDAFGRPVEKLNHGQLGNVVAQLHVHVVGRRSDDSAWPGPVWGAGVAEPYAPEKLAAAVDVAQRALR